jgi:NADH-quinone oxidoreductase subunit F
MKRLNSERLKKLYLKMARFMEVRHDDTITPGEPRYPMHLLICGGTACHASKSLEIEQRLKSEISERKLQDKVTLIETGCNGFCAQGPVMVIYPAGIFYQYLNPDDVGEIIEQHVLKGYPVEKLMYRDPGTGQVIFRMKDIPFFARQQSRVLRNRGLIAAEKIEEYIGTMGYQAALKALTEMTPHDIIAEVKTSGLRGRGGAGFPTGMKWEFTARSQGNVKYVLCNADEGDPGAFMDRSVLEADPHAVLEGMIIAARAIGAHQGYIYCRAEYPLAVKRLNIAIDQARQCGLLGNDILASGFDFDIEVYRGAGAFVCGEETALMTSIEGKRGTPRPRPPFPAVQGLWKKPTVLNNVETLASIPQIILNGGGWHAGIGTLRSKGTKIFALTGDINNVGLVEVAMGMPLGGIIHDIGRGIPNKKKFKAVQLGGPSGGCIPVQHLNTSVDYESITRLGAIIGSGGMIVMDDDKCMVDVARFFMEFCMEESCGKCTSCRVGTQKMLEILTRICNGDGRENDIETLERWAKIMQNTALCGLGQTAPNPVLSTLRYFRHEYEAHIREKHCPAVVCTNLFKSPCQHACPIGMDIPAYIALVKADRLEDAYRVLLKTNPFPGICGRVCDHICETKCRRSTLDEPVNIKYLKRFITDNAPRPPARHASITQKERIAVVGAGPAGLTAARNLVLKGYGVTVFEALPEAGGMLRWGIPEYRLPRNVLGSEIKDILDLGVEISLNTRVGRDISWNDIEKKFQAVFLAAGAQKSAPIGVAGEDLAGVYGAVEFLREFNLGNRPATGSRVAIIGGGNSAIDAARSALRLGAEEVAILYRRLRADMPAQDEEIRAAEEEGVKIHYLVSPLRFEGQNGRVKQVICQKMVLGDFDAGGRREPIPIPNEEFVLEVDLVLPATGQALELDFVKPGIDLTKRGFIKIVDGTKTRTTCDMVFAGGDAVRGPDTVVGAIAAGHRAALEIDTALRQERGESPYTSVTEEAVDIPGTVEEDIRELARLTMPEADIAQRVGDFREVELGFSRQQALTESTRCLRCDIEVE